MLIDDAIKAAKAAGLLHPSVPIEPWAPRPRAFLMCISLRDSIAAAKVDPDEKVRKRWAELEAAISTFVVGGFVNDKLLKQLEEPKFEHWELISRRPKPSLRVFGRFAKPDVFVGTHVVPRKELGGMNSPQFEQEKLVCEDHWKAAGLPGDGFFSAPPSFPYEAYITENAAKKVRVPK
jgi:hypothetical protein